MRGAQFGPGADEEISIPALFREVVAENAARPAILTADGATTYAELDLDTNRIANGLLDGDQSRPVAIVGRNEPEVYTLILGVLKAGRIAAPLDPRQPPEQLAEVCARLGGPVVYPDQSQSLRTDDASDPKIEIAGHDPATVYFTSGSTGRPKGAVTAHTTSVGASRIESFTPDDRIAVLVPASFSLALVPVWSAWLNGTSLACYDLTTEPTSALPAWLATNRITYFTMVPTLLREIANAITTRGDHLPDVRLIAFGGEKFAWSDLATVREAFPNATLQQIYGAAEAGGVTAITVDPSTSLDDVALGVGRALPLRTVEILDDDDRPVPLGTPGHVTVTSQVVALGYWEEPEKTAEKFFVAADGRRALRTGDLGYLLPDGALEVTGRNDLLVKVRGQFVDPQEVERVLTALDDVAAAVVTPMHADDRGTRLVAHVVAAPGKKVSRQSLREALASRVPGPMMPSTFMFLDEIPRNTNGKIDRALLNRSVSREIAAPYEAPKGALEQRVADAFVNVLGLERVGARDDFFDLGGDSLAAVEMLVELSDQLGREIPASLLVQAPTPFELAAQLESRSTVTHLVGTKSDGVQLPLFCVPGGGGNVVSLHRLVRLITDRPVHIFVPKGIEPRGLPDRTIARAARRNVQTMRDARPTGPYQLLGYSFGGMVALEMARLLGDELQLLILLDPAPPAPKGKRRRGIDPRLEIRRFQVTRASNLNELNRALQICARHMVKHHRPKPYDGSTLLFHTGSYPNSPYLGSALLTGDVKIVDLGRDHASLLREPAVDALANTINTALAAADSRSRPETPSVPSPQL